MLAALVSFMVPVVVIVCPLLYAVDRLPIGDTVAHHSTRAYLRCVRVKDGMEHNEQNTEHFINECLVFLTEHLPHIIGQNAH